MSNYKTEILTLIKNDCDQQNKDDEKLIDGENFINVDKSRIIHIDDDITTEFCIISTNVNKRLYISFAVESTVQNIHNYLRSNLYVNSELSVIFEALYIATQIVRFEINLAMNNGCVFLPVGR